MSRSTAFRKNSRKSRSKSRRLKSRRPYHTVPDADHCSSVRVRAARRSGVDCVTDVPFMRVLSPVRCPPVAARGCSSPVSLVPGPVGPWLLALAFCLSLYLSPRYYYIYIIFLLKVSKSMRRAVTVCPENVWSGDTGRRKGTPRARDQYLITCPRFPKLWASGSPELCPVL